MFVKRVTTSLPSRSTTAPQHSRDGPRGRARAWRRGTTDRASAVAWDLVRCGPPDAGAEQVGERRVGRDRHAERLAAAHDPAVDGVDLRRPARAPGPAASTSDARPSTARARRRSRRGTRPASGQRSVTPEARATANASSISRSMSARVSGSSGRWPYGTRSSAPSGFSAAL
jgi:hypothetical protein